jgi:phytoene dehydrogenase-like protein
MDAARKIHDVIVVGAGHNGLVAAAYLAKAGRKVLVLERREVAGGQLAPASYGEGFECDPLHPGGMLRPDIVRALGLARFGLAPDNSVERSYTSLLPDGARLRLSAEPGDNATLDSIRRFSAPDAARWPEFVAFMRKAAAFLDAAYRTTMPRLPHLDLIREGAPLAALALRLRRLGGKDMFRVIRSMSMSAQEFGEEWFESEPVKAALAALAIHGSTLGSMSAGTGYTLMHNWLNRGGLAQPAVKGGTHTIGAALVAALKSYGGELRTSAEVERIVVEHQGVSGVRLVGGEEIPAQTVFSAADPKRTLLGLVGAPELPPEFVWQTQSIKLRGSVAKVHWLTDGNHGLPAGTLVVAPTLRYLERAYDAAKYGAISAAPYLEVTTAGKVVSVHFQFAPYLLRDGDWQSGRATVEQLARATVAGHFPKLIDSLRHARSLIPPELESTYSLSEGDLNHGQLLLDQMFFMRPLPGWSNHKTPIDGLYLCGSGGHGGGGISGGCGRNAARIALSAR